MEVGQPQRARHNARKLVVLVGEPPAQCDTIVATLQPTFKRATDIEPNIWPILVDLEIISIG